MKPLIACSSLRIDVAGTAAVDGLSFASESHLQEGPLSEGPGGVLLLGAPRELFEAAAGLRAIEHGELTLGGIPAIDAVRSGAATGAPRDPPLPTRWTVRQFIFWSARLSGQSGANAAASTEEALGRLQLGPFASTRLGRAPLTVQRAAVLGAALASEAATILVEDPFADLRPEAARTLARVMVRALTGRHVLFFGSRLALDSPMSLAADEAIAIAGSHVLMQGAPAELAASEGTFGVTVAGDAGAFVDALRAMGARIVQPSPATVPARFTVHLGAIRTTDLFRMAATSRAVVLELRPLAFALA